MIRSVDKQKVVVGQTTGLALGLQSVSKPVCKALLLKSPVLHHQTCGPVPADIPQSSRVKAYKLTCIMHTSNLLHSPCISGAVAPTLYYPVARCMTWSCLQMKTSRGPSADTKVDLHEMVTNTMLAHCHRRTDWGVSQLTEKSTVCYQPSSYLVLFVTF